MGYRAVCVARGEAASLPGFDENATWPTPRSTMSPGELLEEFAHVREGHLAFFRHLSPEAGGQTRAWPTPTPSRYAPSRMSWPGTRAIIWVSSRNATCRIFRPERGKHGHSSIIPHYGGGGPGRFRDSSGLVAGGRPGRDQDRAERTLWAFSCGACASTGPRTCREPWPRSGPWASARSKARGCGSTAFRSSKRPRRCRFALHVGAHGPRPSARQDRRGLRRGEGDGSYLGGVSVDPHGNKRASRVKTR